MSRPFHATSLPPLIRITALAELGTFLGLVTWVLFVPSPICFPSKKPGNLIIILFAIHQSNFGLK